MARSEIPQTLKPSNSIEQEDAEESESRKAESGKEQVTCPC
jgi:hypothetical protein